MKLVFSARRDRQQQLRRFTGGAVGKRASSKNFCAVLALLTIDKKMAGIGQADSRGSGDSLVNICYRELVGH